MLELSRYKEHNNKWSSNIIVVLTETASFGWHFSELTVENDQQACIWWNQSQTVTAFLASYLKCNLQKLQKTHMQTINWKNATVFLHSTPLSHMLIGNNIIITYILKTEIFTAEKLYLNNHRGGAIVAPPSIESEEDSFEYLCRKIIVMQPHKFYLDT